MPVTEAAPEKMQFKTELKQLLDLIIHSLYTKKEIFLRELISNAADAIDKVRFESLKNTDLLQGDSDWKIKLTTDKDAGTLTVSDNGIGMDRDTIVDHLGTIAKSGTKAFMENLKKAEAADKPELIGQFGVGFYASFMAADRVTVVSKPAHGEAVRWESDGQGEFTVEPAERFGRGKQYSDFIDHPVVIDAETEKDGVKSTKEETINSRQAIWLRSKNEVKPEEYEAFYKQIARDFQPPLKTIHVALEGAMEFRALMFIPAAQPMEWMMGGPPSKSGLDLYVRRVLIQHECEELLPSWLRFIKGVVDSSDLPLNVSRETLQHNPVLARIQKNLISRVLRTLEEMRTGEYETYLKFFEAFGEVLKEGVGQDFTNREKIAEQILFPSLNTESGKFTTLDEYISKMKADQTEIFYLIGETRGLLEHSPFVESIKAAGQDVLLLTDPVDEYMMGHLHEYKGKKIRAADKAEKPSDLNDEQKKQAETFKPLLEDLKKKLTAARDVRLSHRLKESAACLVADEYAPTAHMERLMKRMGQGSHEPYKRTLELNPDHPVVQKLLARFTADAADPKVESYARLLFDQATIAEGSPIQDPAGFAKRINELMTA
jgi:molecular chaperone HtpG